MLRSALKWGKADVILDMWRYFLHLFLATNKYHYSLITLQFCWTMHALHEDVKDAFNSMRSMSWDGTEGSGIAIDAVNEMV